MQMLAPEIKFSAASHSQICNNDNVAHETDDDNPHEHDHVVQVIDGDDLGNEDVCENNVCDAGMNVIETDDLDLFLHCEICPVFQNDIDDEDSIPALAVYDHDDDTGANCSDDGDTIGNNDDVLDLPCHTHNIDDDSSGDKTSDDVDTIEEDTVGNNDDRPPLFSSSDDDLNDGEDDIVLNNHIPHNWSSFTIGCSKAFWNDIYMIIADLNKFCLFS